MKPSLMIGLCLLGIATAAPVFPRNPLDAAMDTQVRTQKDGAQSQARIDALDDQRITLLAEYRAVNRELDDLRAYNRQMERLTADQRREVAELERGLQEIEITKRQMLPQLARMVEVLEQFVALDLPFLGAERGTRIEHLRRLMDQADVPLPEKYRRVMEAYLIEVQYGHTIEAYDGDVQVEGRTRTVQFLRLGRIGLYYLSPDGKQAGYWNRSAGTWEPLPSETRRPIAKGIRMARKQAAPDLVRLPVPAPEHLP